MDLSNLAISNSLTEIIKVYKQFKHMVFENWCVMHCDELIHAKDQFVHQIETLNNHDPKYPVRVCIGAIVLSHFSNARLETCSKLLSKIKPPREVASSQFISRYIAKYCNKVKSTSHFFDKQLEMIKDLLQPSRHRHQIIYAQNLLINFSIYATHTIDSCLSAFVEVLISAFQHNLIEVVDTASKALNNYFKLTKQKQYLPNLYNSAIQFINSKMKSGIIILTSLIDYFPERFIDRAENMMEIAQNLQTKERSLCYNLEIMVVPIHYDIFIRIAKNIVNQIWPLNKASKLSIEFIQLLKNIIRKCPDALTDRIDSFIKIISKLVKSPDNSLISQGSEILLLFLQHLPNHFNQKHARIKKLILKANFTEDFANAFQTIILRNENVWNDLRPDLGNLLTKIYDERKTDIFVKIIAFVPDIPSYCINPLTVKIQYLFTSDNSEILLLIPNSILALSRRQSQLNSYKLGKMLIVNALTTDSWELRLAILDAFKPPYPDYLADPEFLEHFSIFVNDEQFKVKLAALKILSGIASMNPAMIYPMFRGIILDVLFLCNSSKSMRLRCDSTECLPIIFSNVPDLLPIYVPVFIPIFIHYMNHHLSHTVIDEKVLEAVKKNTKPVPVYGKPSLGLSPSFLSNENQNSHINSMSGSFGNTHSPFIPSSTSTSSLSSQKDYSFSGPAPNYISSPSIPNIDAFSQQISEEQMTFFDRIFATKISINYIKAIGCICEQNFDLILPDLEEINSLFMKTLATTGQKKVLLATLSTLGIITDKLGPKEAAKIPDFVTTLITIGSKLMSSKVHSAIFSILGRIGLVTPTDEKEEDNNMNELIEISKESNEYYDLSVPLEDFFIRIIKTNLDFLLDDKGEASLHYQAHNTLTQMFSSCKKSVNAQRLFNSYMIRLFTTIHSVSPDEKKSYFSLLGQLLTCPSEWLQRFTPHFLRMIEENWEIEKSNELLDLIPQIASSLKDSCAPYIPRLVAMLLDELEVLAFDSSSTQYKSSSNNLLFNHDESIQKTITTLTSMSNFTSNFIFIIVNKISDVIVHSNLSKETIIVGLDSLRSLVQRFDCTNYSSIIFRTSVYCIELDSSLESNSYQVLYSLAVSIGKKFDIYKSSLLEKKLLNQGLINIITKNEYPKTFSDFRFIKTDQETVKFVKWNKNDAFDEEYFKSNIPSPFNLGSHEQWKSWMKNFIQHFIIHSPFPAIKSCAQIASKSFIFSRKIFNASFLSCWIQLSNETKGNIKTFISIPLNSIETPMSVITILISLIEFTERARFPIEDRNNFNKTKWAFRAEKPTFALYCAQMDFDSQENYSSGNIQQIIQAYSQLDMNDEIKGVTKVSGILNTLPEKLENELSKLEQFEKWDEIASYFPRYNSLTVPEKRSTSVIYAHAFYHLKKWDEFDQILSEFNKESDAPLSIICKCIRNVSAGKDISEMINYGFTTLGSQGGPLFMHGFTAVSPFIVTSEQFVELYEFFIKHDTSMWEQRLSNAKSNFKTIRPLLHMRIDLLERISKEQHHEAVLSYLKMARKSKEWEYFEHFLDMHFKGDANHDIYTGYEYSHLLWNKGKEDEAIQRIDEMLMKPKSEPIFARLYYKKAKWIARKNDSAVLLFSENKFENQEKNIKDDENQLKIQSQLLNQMQEVRFLCKQAKNIRKYHYPTLNLWAWSSMRVFDIGTDDREIAAVEAIKGFAHCVNLDIKNTFSDLLQMISVLFRSISIPNVFSKVKKLIYSIDIKRYIKIIPQLIMYKQTSSKPHRRFVLHILKSMLQKYPNAAIFPLLFVKHFTLKGQINNEGNEEGKEDNINNNNNNDANCEDDDKDICDILDHFKLQNPDFFNAAEKVLTGLQNACFTFSEFLIEVLNNIYNYIETNDVKNLLSSIPKLMERIKTTTCQYDMIVLSRYRDRLRTISLTFENYMRNQANNNNTQQNQRSKKLFPDSFINELSKFINLVMNDSFHEPKLSLKVVAPNLADFSFPQLSVFNTFKPDATIIGVSKIVDELKVKQSKQRPKKLKMIGTNGKTYKFLLKGHEDLRLDQRVMQFFELMNSITSLQNNMLIPQIIICGVTPLSPNVGVIQWVSGCDTMYELISNYRKIKYKNQIKCIEYENELLWKKVFVISEKKLKANKNLKMILNPNNANYYVDKLRPVQKLEYFKRVNDKTKEMRLDLRDVMWINAHDAESWVRYTINFSKTTALMSIVGYIIGLGDRHPENIMIQKLSGHVVHIDFGDCFEVTKERDKLAENIPFRLTRNMIATFGPCSTEGTFRKTCEETISAIRQRREAVMSTLEIFIRDPTTSGGVFEAFQTDKNGEQKRLKEKISRISKKINGLDFENTTPLSVAEQFDALVKSATDTYNLSYLYHGWNPLW